MENIQVLWNTISEKRYKHQPELIKETKEVTILWDFVIDRKINSNRGEVVVKNNKSKTCYLTE